MDNDGISNCNTLLASSTATHIEEICVLRCRSTYRNTSVCFSSIITEAKFSVFGVVMAGSLALVDTFTVSSSTASVIIGGGFR